MFGIWVCFNVGLSGEPQMAAVILSVLENSIPSIHPVPTHVGPYRDYNGNDSQHFYSFSFIVICKKCVASTTSLYRFSDPVVEVRHSTVDGGK